MILPVDNASVIEKCLKTEGCYVSLTSGVSMRPLFKTHRDVVVISSPKEELRKYDVALYPRGDGRYVLHRVVGVKDDVYLIRGDNTYKIERVPKSLVVGVMTAFNRKGKQYDLSEFSYKFYSRFWNFIYPVRYLLWIARRLLFKIKRALLKVLK